MPALMKIKSAYASLPTAERKVADFILEDPQRASLMVINEIAAAAEVSVPSVTRLSKKLGYDGFMSFRVALASGISNPSPLDVEPIRANDPDDVAAEKLLLLVSKCIEDTAKVLDAKKLSNFCDAILNAKRVLKHAVVKIFYYSFGNLVLQTAAEKHAEGHCKKLFAVFFNKGGNPFVYNAHADI